MLVLNGLEDQILLLVLGKIPVDLLNGFPYNDIFQNLLSTEPLFNFYLYILRYFFNEHYVVISVIIITILNLSFSYLFFKKYIYWFLGVLTFVFSSYYYIHLANHLSLMNTWLIPLLFIFMDNFNIKNLKSIVIFISFLITSILISNYIGLLITIIFILYYLYDISYALFIKNKVMIKVALKLLFISSIVLIFSFLLLSYFKNSSEVEISYYINRPLGDFYTFSVRPWYFFIPSQKHIIYGNLADNIITFFYSFNNYLTDDYFPKEHLASFFGYTTLFLFLYSSLLIFKEKNNILMKNWFKLTFINIILFLLMLPPYITFNGFTTITPGYIFYKFLPMFRTTVRFSILIHFNFLIIILSFIENIHDNLNIKKRITFKILIIITTLLILFETFIPIKVETYNKSPLIYEYIGANYPSSNIFIYPYSQTQEALFWVDKHKSYLFNPKFYKRKNYESESLTDNLITHNGLNTVKELGVDIIIVSKDISDNYLYFFKNSNLLNKIYDDNSYILYSFNTNNQKTPSQSQPN